MCLGRSFLQHKLLWVAEKIAEHIDYLKQTVENEGTNIKCEPELSISSDLIFHPLPPLE